MLIENDKRRATCSISKPKNKTFYQGTKNTKRQKKFVKDDIDKVKTSIN